MNGFDARLWELYLFCVFNEQGFRVTRTHDRPDFLIHKISEIAVEAVTVGRKHNDSKPIGALKHRTIEDMIEENKNDMPLRFSNALSQKLKKKYWTLPHVQGKPLIIAIADFHDEMTMTWSFSALTELLYGYRHFFYYEGWGDLVVSPVKVDEYTKKNGARIPSGFFFWPESEHISAVLFSSTATLAKFNRIGKQAGFGNDQCTLFRAGVAHDHDRRAATPLPFSYTVGPESGETWVEGASIFHNPKALIPLDPRLFPNFSHHWYDKGQIVSDIPEFHPYFSITYNHVVSGKE